MRKLILLSSLLTLLPLACLANLSSTDDPNLRRTEQGAFVEYVTEKPENCPTCNLNGAKIRQATTAKAATNQQDPAQKANGLDGNGS